MDTMTYAKIEYFLHNTKVNKGDFTEKTNFNINHD